MANRKKLKLSSAEKKKFKKKISERTKIREIEVPELEGVFSDRGEKCFFKIKPADLDDHIRASNMNNKTGHALLWINSKVRKGEVFSMDELLSAIEGEEGEDHLHPNTMFEIDLFRKCVKSPAFTLKEVIGLSHSYPGVVNRISTLAMGYTQ